MKRIKAKIKAATHKVKQKVKQLKNDDKFRKHAIHVLARLTQIMAFLLCAGGILAIGAGIGSAIPGVGTAAGLAAAGPFALMLAPNISKKTAEKIKKLLEEYLQQPVTLVQPSTSLSDIKKQEVSAEVSQGQPSSKNESSQNQPKPSQGQSNSRNELNQEPVKSKLSENPLTLFNCSKKGNDVQQDQPKFAEQESATSFKP